MKKRLMVFTASALLLGFNSASAAPGCPTMGGFGGRGQGCGVTMMEERLGLNEKQSVKIDELQSNHFRKVSVERRKLATLERELQEESLKANPDGKKVEQLSEKVGKQHAALARLGSAHVAEISAILTPEQRDSMRTMMDDLPLRGNRGIRPR